MLSKSVSLCLASAAIAIFTSCSDKKSGISDDDNFTLRYKIATPISDTDPANEVLVNIIETRLEHYGIDNPGVSIVEDGAKYLEISIPDDADTAAVNSIVTAHGVVEFYPTVSGAEIGLNDNTIYVVEVNSADAKNRIDNEINNVAANLNGLAFKWMSDNDGDYLYALDTDNVFRPVITDIEADTNRGYTQIDMTFDQESAQAWRTITRNNIGRSIAIVVDGEILSAPRVNTEIEGGRSAITGHFTPEQAQILAAQLSAANLDIVLVPVK